MSNGTTSLSTSKTKLALELFLRLAKLDFNVLQKCYQDELRIISRRAGVYTSCYPMAAVAWICGMAETGSKEAFEWMSKNPKIVVASSDIGRLMDDITSHEFEQERGHVASAVECCMKQYGVSKGRSI
ncbi:hypothetical protein D5086_010400 [Populus alba]|uniref:Uncharacterized protein n=1 Tax=Populus alba TaxID=43335 RepID=A0ACC4CAI6_POPAL